jgi:hypothetical protein
MGSPAKDGETARAKLIELLAKHGFTWNDLGELLAKIREVDSPSPQPAAAAPTAADIPDLLGVLTALIEEHVSVSAEERLAITLWILHTWVYDRFVITPRLALLSPVRGCGKTTALSLIELLIPEGTRVDSTTPAAIYHQLDRHHLTTLLIDEADNLDLGRNPPLRSVFNSGHRRGGKVERFVGGRRQRYRTHAPLAIALSACCRYL